MCGGTSSEGRWLLFLNTLVIPEAGEFEGEEKKNGLAVLGVEARDLRILVFWDLATIRPYVLAMEEDEVRADFLSMLDTSGLPEVSSHPPLLIGGWVAYILVCLCESYGEEAMRDNAEFLKAADEDDGASLISVFSYEFASGETILFLFYADKEGIEHFRLFFSGQTALAFVQSESMFTPEEKVRILEEIASPNIPPSSGMLDIHISGFAACHLRFALLESVGTDLLPVPEEDDMDPDADPPEEVFN